MHDNGEEIKKVERKIQNMLADEEIYWKQRLRVDWLKRGIRKLSSSITRPHLERKRTKYGGLRMQPEDKKQKMLKMNFVITSQNYSQHPAQTRIK